MATATQVLAESPLEGASIVLVYDDVTLIGSALQATVSNTAIGPMTINVTTASGFSGTFAVPVNRFNQVFSIPSNRRPQGVLITGRSGVQSIDWRISAGISFNG